MAYSCIKKYGSTSYLRFGQVLKWLLIHHFVRAVETQQQTNGRLNDQMVETQRPNQRHVGPDRLVHQILTVSATINPEKSLLWDPDPGPS